jgi:hypothetical protein
VHVSGFQMVIELAHAWVTELVHVTVWMWVMQLDCELVHGKGVSETEMR